MYKTILFIGLVDEQVINKFVQFSKKKHLIIFNHISEIEADKIKKYIISKTNNSKIIYIICDYSTFYGASIIVDFFNKRCSKIDLILIQYFEVVNCKNVTIDGFSELSACNLIIPFYIISKLLSLFKGNHSMDFIFLISGINFKFIKNKIKPIELIKAESDVKLNKIFFLLLWYDFFLNTFSLNVTFKLYFTNYDINNFQKIINKIFFLDRSRVLNLICFSSEYRVLSGIIINDQLKFIELPLFLFWEENRKLIIKYIELKIFKLNLVSEIVQK